MQAFDRTEDTARDSRISLGPSIDFIQLEAEDAEGYSWKEKTECNVDVRGKGSDSGRGGGDVAGDERHKLSLHA